MANHDLTQLDNYTVILCTICLEPAWELNYFADAIVFQFYRNASEYELISETRKTLTALPKVLLQSDNFEWISSQN